MSEGLPLSVAVVSVVLMELVALAIGFFVGRADGARGARLKAFHQCIDWAALAMKGNPEWRRLSPDQALTKAGCLIAGEDVLPAEPTTVTHVASLHYESAAAVKGHAS